MKAKFFLIAVGMMLIWVCGARATLNIDIYSDKLIKNGDEYNTADVYDTPPSRTTVTMIGGIVGRMETFDSSVLNITDGDISILHAYDFSTVNASGGYIHSPTAWDSSTINISGTFNAVEVGATATGIVNVMGGSMKAIAGWGGVINLYGGTVTDNMHAVSGWVNVFGYDLEKSSTGGKYGYGYVSGFWNDGTALTIDIGSSGTYSHINLVPEPASLILLTLGSLIIRRRR